MIPNRGVLLATGSDEPNGITRLLTIAIQSIRESPWPLSGELFLPSSSGVEIATVSGTDAELLAHIKRIDIAAHYDAQKTALQTHFQSVGDDVYVASFGLIGKKDAPSESKSWCSWTQGVRSLLPTTDLVAFVWT